MGEKGEEGVKNLKKMGDICRKNIHVDYTLLANSL